MGWLRSKKQVLLLPLALFRETSGRVDGLRCRTVRIALVDAARKHTVLSKDDGGTGEEH